VNNKKTTQINLEESCPSAWNKSAPTGRIFMEFDIRGFFENL
jgi:hypothetical protein